MIKFNAKAVAALVAGLAVVGFVGAAPVQAQEKHDSNTLHKIGKAIQYTTRKDTENLSTDVHRGANHKSVVHNRKSGTNVVVTPGGHKILKSTTKPHYFRRHHLHRYYKKYTK